MGGQSMDLVENQGVKGKCFSVLHPHHLFPNHLPLSSARHLDFFHLWFGFFFYYCLEFAWGAGWRLGGCVCALNLSKEL